MTTLEFFLDNGVLCPVCNRGIATRAYDLTILPYVVGMEVSLKIKCPYCGQNYNVNGKDCYTHSDHDCEIYPLHVVDA